LRRKGHDDRAIADAQRAIDLDQNFATAYLWMAQTLTYSGKPAEAIGFAEKAMRVDPQNPDFYLVEVGEDYVAMGRHREAIPVLKRSLLRYSNNLGSHLFLAIAYAELGQELNARAEAAEILRISPQYSLEASQSRRSPWRGQLKERYLADLRKAGLK